MTDLLRRHAERTVGGSPLETAGPSPSPHVVGDAPADFVEDTREVVSRELVAEQAASPRVETSSAASSTRAVAPITEPARPTSSEPAAPAPARTLPAPEPTQPRRDESRARPPVVEAAVVAPIGPPVAPVAAPRPDPVEPAALLRAEWPPAPRVLVQPVEARQEVRPLVAVTAPPLERPTVIVRELERVAVPAAPSMAALPAVELSSARSGVPAPPTPPAPGPPPVRVTIGRVDVRASLAAPDRVVPAKPHTEPATLPLADYLAGRGTIR